MKSKRKILVSIIILIVLVLSGYFKDDITEVTSKLSNNSVLDNVVSVNSTDIPDYDGTDVIVLNDNNPEFDSSDFKTTSFESYSELDSLGRCGVAYANVSNDTMPRKKRESIGSVKPTGWHNVKYDSVDGKYLYNRCHLIGYQLTGENANEKNLITCTRYMNAVSMLYYENKIASYIKETDNHVLYRVTPIFDGDNLLAKGAKMEGYSIEDNGVGIKFNVFVYNVQKGIEIDYKTGESSQNE